MGQKQHRMTIVVLGALSALGPFSIDMYLPGFPAIARDLHTDVAHVGLTLTSYFIGISIGQLAYGPMLDRYGRKGPLLVGLIVFIATAVGCAFSQSIHALIALRFFLALGCCVGMAGSSAVVRDLFTGNEAARAMSTMMMVSGIAPITAPTVGGLVVAALGWRYVFLLLAAIAVFVLFAVKKALKGTKGPDPTVSLHPKDVILGYVHVFGKPRFAAYVACAGVVTGGFFTYIAGSPFVFINLFGFTAAQYGWIFGINSCALILGNQVNRILLKRYEGPRIIVRALTCQFAIAIVLLVGTLMGALPRMAALCLIISYTFCFGFVNPNAVAQALLTFKRNVGSAAASFGSVTMISGALASALLSYLQNGTAAPMAYMMTGCALIGLVLGTIALRLEAPPPEVLDIVLEQERAPVYGDDGADVE